MTPLMQEIFLMAQNSNDHQLQQYAAWAMSFLRHHIWSKELLNIDSNIQTDASGSKIAPHSFPEDSIVMKLSSWLNCRNFSVVGLFLKFDHSKFILVLQVDVYYI